MLTCFDIWNMDIQSQIPVRFRERHFEFTLQLHDSTHVMKLLLSWGSLRDNKTRIRDIILECTVIRHVCLVGGFTSRSADQLSFYWTSKRSSASSPQQDQNTLRSNKFYAFHKRKYNRLAPMEHYLGYHSISCESWLNMNPTNRLHSNDISI